MAYGCGISAPSPFTILRVSSINMSSPLSGLPLANSQKHELRPGVLAKESLPDEAHSISKFKSP